MAHRKIQTPAELVARMRETLVPHGDADVVLLRLRSPQGFDFLECNSAEVKELLDEMEKVVLRSFIDEVSPLEKLAIRVLLGSAFISPQDVDIGEMDAVNEPIIIDEDHRWVMWDGSVSDVT
jgi:hypothetical protein